MENKSFCWLKVFSVGTVCWLVFGAYANVSEIKDVGIRSAYTAVDELMQAQNKDDLKRVVDEVRQLWPCYQVFVSHALREKLCLTGKMASEMTEKVESEHDLSLASGRAAWLAEKMLGSSLPPITGMTSEKILAETGGLLLIKQNEIDGARSDAVLKLLREEIPKLPLERRIELAQTNSIDVILLGVLAFDEDPRVRLAVAKNDLTDGRDLRGLMEREKAGEIYDEAKKYVYLTRPFPNPRKQHPAVTIQDVVPYNEKDLIESPFFRNYTDAWFKGSNVISKVTTAAVKNDLTATNKLVRSVFSDASPKRVEKENTPSTTHKSIHEYRFEISAAVAGLILIWLIWKWRKNREKVS